MATNIVSVPVKEKLDETNYNLWSLKVQFFVNNEDMGEFLTATMSALADRNEHGKDVTTCEHYHEKLKAYQT